jgi:hypothetical protein
MKIKHVGYSVLLLAMAVVLIPGCSWIGGYGKIRLSSEQEDGMSIQKLQDTLDDYHVFYAGPSSKLPSGLIFDPKHDERKLTGDRWTRVDDGESISEIIGWMKTYTEFPPRLHVLLGPDNELYGYLFYPVGYEHVVTKVIDDGTLYVYDLESPVYRNTPADRPRKK